MKMLYLFLLLVFSSNAQLNYFAEYNGSIQTREIGQSELVVSNSISFGVKKDKTLYSLGIGREDWNLDHFRRQYYEPSLFTYHTRTYKITFLIEHQYLIPKTKLSLRFGIGGKVYFLNQLKTSFTYQDNYISEIKPSTISKLSPYYSSSSIDGFTFESQDHYYYITHMPLAVRANFVLQYNFKKWALKLYYEPYVMSVRFRNAADSKDWGRSIIWFNDIGIGVNYPLNFKKKKEK